MDKQQKEIQQIYLDNEKKVLNDLKKNYQDALNEIDNRIALLKAREDVDLQHVIYQIDYQRALKAQVQAILDTLQSNNFETISGYLTASYEDGFIGTMYQLQSQGIPFVFPLDQDRIVAAIQHETKLSTSLYEALGKDTKDLSKKIAGEISRGFSNAAPVGTMSRNIANHAGISRNNAMRIARTESHRIQCTSGMDALKRSKNSGADVVKQWDASLDDRTRDAHRQLDGQIREIDEPFEVAGMTAMYPGGFGVAAQDIHCRCALLSRARLALDNDYTKWAPDAPVEISDDGTTQLFKIEAKNYEEFKKQYYQAIEKIVKNDSMKIEHSEIYNALKADLDSIGVKYNPVEKYKTTITTDMIIKQLGGGDMTNGSCSSLAFAYAANRSGHHVLDFRGGESCSFFGSNKNILSIAQLPNINSVVVEEYSDFDAAKELLDLMEDDKEYYFAPGCHAAVVRKTEGKYQYLELQSETENGWIDFSTNTLKMRFGCKRSHSVRVGGRSIKYKQKTVLIEVDSLSESDDFNMLTGYINTAVNEQKKGAGGSVK